jgi:4-hydroxybenzoate polyprenyltransferase
LMIVLLQVATLVLMALVGLEFQRGLVYFLSLVVAAGYFFNQFRRARQRDREACFAAFLNNHRVGMVIFIGIAADYLIAQQPMAAYF